MVLTTAATAAAAAAEAVGAPTSGIATVAAASAMVTAVRQCGGGCGVAAVAVEVSSVIVGGVVTMAAEWQLGAVKA